MTPGYTTEQLASRAAAKARFKEKNPNYHREYGRAQRAAELAAIPPLDSKGLTLFVAWCLLKVQDKQARQRAWSEGYRAANPEKVKGIQKRRRDRLDPKIENARSREWAALHPDESKAAKKRYRDAHRKEIQVQGKRYREENREEILAREKKRREERYGSDANYKLVNILRARLRVALEGKSKAENTLKLLGCTIEFFRQHIENQFLPGMLWENHGPVWELDHILPCAKFHLQHSEEQEVCFHWTNFQPLLKEDNRRKSDKIL